MTEIENYKNMYFIRYMFEELTVQEVINLNDIVILDGDSKQLFVKVFD